MKKNYIKPEMESALFATMGTLCASDPFDSDPEAPVPPAPGRKVVF